jgi:hypothetical protein
MGSERPLPQKEETAMTEQTILLTSTRPRERSLGCDYARWSRYRG